MIGGFLLALLAAASLLVLPPAIHAEPLTLRVGLFDMPPFYSKNAEGRPTGELIATLEQVMNELELDWEPRFSTTPEALKGLVNGDLDLMMVIHHPMLKAKAIYGRVPVARMELMAFHGRGQAPAASLADLRGQRVALLRGYGYGGLVGQLMAPDSNLKLQVADGHQEAFEWLSQGKVDYVLDYRRPGRRAIEQLKLQDIEGDRLRKIEVYFVVSAKLADGEVLLGRMDEALQKANP